MNEYMRFSAKVLMIAVIALATLVFLSGCREEQPMAHDDHAGHDHAAMDDAPAGDAVVIAQKTCPVMEGNPINKDIFVEYEGKKVYFCCAGCPETFLADPEKYISKLPQFTE